jgi:uncharacterized protein (DUF1778 family)
MPAPAAKPSAQRTPHANKLDCTQSEAFVHALLNPPEPNAALRRAAEHYKAR